MNKTSFDHSNYSNQDFARQILDAEAQAIKQIPVNDSFDSAVELVFKTAPHSGVVTCGLGKSGIIARKLAATFASTGTPAHFLHPTEAVHGDLGRVRRGDVVLMLSFSGNTQELVDLATILRQDDIKIIAIVASQKCDLGRLASCTIELGGITEACPLGLAPTASTTAMLAIGDALALSVAKRRNFGADDFQRFHPGGGLGKQLTPVAKAMRFKAGHNLPLINTKATLNQAYQTAKTLAEQSGLRRAGALVVVDKQGLLAGIFTDGDLRRLVFKQPTENLLSQPIGAVMTQNPHKLKETDMVRSAVQLIREYRLDELPVVDAGNRPVGLIDVQDLVALKVIEE